MVCDNSSQSCGRVCQELSRGVNELNLISSKIDGFFLKSGSENVRHVLQWSRNNPTNKLTCVILDIEAVHRIFMEYITGMETLMDEYNHISETSNVSENIFIKLQKTKDSYRVFIENLFDGKIKNIDNELPLVQSAPVQEVINNIAFLVDFKDILVEMAERMKDFMIPDSSNQKVLELRLGITIVYVSSIITYAYSVLRNTSEVVQAAEKAIDDSEISNKYEDVKKPTMLRVF